MRLMDWIFAACLFTASCDVVLIVNVGGNLRFSQLMLVLVCLAALGRAAQNGNILWPRGGMALMLWLLSQLIFLPLSGVLSIGISFFVLLAFTIVGYFAVLQLYGRTGRIDWLMKVYLLSYVVVAIFGLLQFITPLLGLPGMFVVQWIVHGKLARINGFSYEPSYFATYLMMGWIMLIELWISGAEITRGRFWKIATILCTLALLLSTSKTAYLFMPFELILRVLPHAGTSLRRFIQNIVRGRLLLRLPRANVIVSSTLGFICFCIIAYAFTRIVPAVSLLNGSGLGGTPSHSWLIRLGQATATYDAFLAHPWVGRSLGGVPVYIAAQAGVAVHSMDDVRLYWGFPVLLDILAASGIFGFIPFLIFVYRNTFGAMRIARRYMPSEEAKWLRALARAAIFECLMLLADQNVLRIYVWYQMTMVSLIAYRLEFGTAQRFLAKQDSSAKSSLEVTHA